MTNDKGIAKKSEFPIRGHMQRIDQSACKKESENGRQLDGFVKQRQIHRSYHQYNIFSKFNSSSQIAVCSHIMGLDSYFPWLLFNV